MLRFFSSQKPPAYLFHFLSHIVTPL